MARDVNEAVDYPSEEDRKSYYGIYDNRPDHDSDGVEDARHNVRRPDEGLPRQDCGCCDSCWSRISSVNAPLGQSPFGCTSFMLWAISSLFFWAILWGLATSFPTEHALNLWPGETWEVSKPPLWSRTTLALTASSSDPGIEVYEFSPTMEGELAKCPPTTLQSAKRFKSTKNVTLQQDVDYQYDSFHLNVGSQLTVDLRQLTGSVNVYLLQGYGQLKRLQQQQQQDAHQMDSEGDVHHDFRATSILKRFSAKGGETTFTYQVENRADFFILVYDIASPSTSTASSSLMEDLTMTVQLTVTLDIDMTTHLLPVGRMVCSALDTFNGGCLWTFPADHDRKRVADSCIIIKAVSSQLDQQGEADPTIVLFEGDISQQPVVQVALVANVGSPTLWLIACIPVWIALILIVREYGYIYWWRRSHSVVGVNDPSESSWYLGSLDQYHPVSTNGELDHTKPSDINNVRSYQHA